MEEKEREGPATRLDEQLRAIVVREGAELSGLSVVVVRDSEIAYEGAFGSRRLGEGRQDEGRQDAPDPSSKLPVRPDSLFRVASLSKPVVGIAAMILVERGLLDLEEDVSAYLGFELRNPAYPRDRISAGYLLDHTSSLRDAELYNLPLGRRLDELLVPGGALCGADAHFASPVPGEGDLAPGRFYCYCNLNYGVLATVIERITRQRFDRFMREIVFAPLGLDASFNILDLSEGGFASLATLYRKRREAPDGGEAWDPSGPWIPQFDDHRGKRPAIAWRQGPGMGEAAIEDYEIGTNGTLFSPQGGLRISAPSLAKIMRLLIGRGEVEGRRLLSRASVDRMLATRWLYDGARGNGELSEGESRATGLALSRGTGSRDALGGDRLLPEGGPLLWGHRGNAYGFLGGMRFDPDSGFGFIFMIGGLGRDPRGYRGAYSSFTRWEEEIHEAILGEFYEAREGTGYPRG